MLPNVDRIQQLLLMYVGEWDPDEADHQSICVEIGPNDSDLVNYNAAFRQDKPEFAPAAERPEVAAASHSHLNLAMQGVIQGVLTSLPGLQKFCRDGRLCLDIIQAVDRDLFQHCQRGLAWEVLSSKMALEEPGGFDIIQAAMNAKNSSGLMEHEMEHLNGLATCICKTGQGMTDQFNWRLVRQHLMDSGNTVVAEAPEFLQLCQFVCHALGEHSGGTAENGSYNHWAEMKQWHETMINPKTRRIRLATIAQMAHVPLKCPRLRNALFRAAYSGSSPTAEQIKHGTVFLKTLSSLLHLKEEKLEPVLVFAEGILEHWHINYTASGAFNHMKPKIQCALWAQVEPKLVACIMKRATPELMRKALVVAAREEDVFLRKKVPNGVVRTLASLPLGEDTATAAEQAGAVVAETVSPPAFPHATYDKQGKLLLPEGVVTTPQPTETDVVIDLENSESSAEIARSKAELMVALWRARDLLAPPPVKVIGVKPAVPSRKTFVRTKVVLTQDVAPFELVLVPVVKNLESVVQKTGGKSAAVKVLKMKPNGELITLYLLPLTVHSEGKERFMPPYWCVHHGTHDAANMVSDELDVNGILTLASQDETKSRTRMTKNEDDKCTVPVMTNPTSLLKGTEIIFKRYEPSAPPSKPHQPVTWLGVESKEFKRELAKK